MLLISALKMCMEYFGTQVMLSLLPLLLREMYFFGYVVHMLYRAVSLKVSVVHLQNLHTLSNSVSFTFLSPSEGPWELLMFVTRGVTLFTNPISAVVYVTTRCAQGGKGKINSAFLHVCMHPYIHRDFQHPLSISISKSF